MAVKVVVCVCFNVGDYLESQEHLLVLCVQAWFAASDLGWVVGHSYIVYAPLLHCNTTILYEVSYCNVVA